MTDLSVRNGELTLAASVYGNPGNPDVMLIHGLSGCRDTWEEAVARLVDRYQVWTLDLHGHGHSDRSDDYGIAGFVADAGSLLDVIGRPTVVVGHSLGAVVAGVLGQQPHPLVRAVFLEDPPWYLGEPHEWDKGLYKVIFPMIRAQQVEMQSRSAPLDEWVRAVGSAPSPKGGTADEHVLPRHVLSSASARMRHDPAAWDASIEQTMLDGLRVDDPIRVPVTVIQADPALGPAFMPGHDDRFLATNPEATIVRYDGATHLVHAGVEHAERFFDDLDAFVTAHAAR
jgi:pimeloyl-ACP methyl ester carboxylesterase